jgi:photosystem II stability/assembly factor-like uncharacterized protein
MLAAPELAQANEGAGPSTGGRHKSSGVLALYKAKAAPLPSGLPELSTAAMNAELILAIDGAGGVFLSEDGGSHWVAVAKQWSGRAVVVRLEKSSGANQGAAPPPAAVFEIANDRGQDWVSTDGRNWKAK